MSQDTIIELHEHSTQAVSLLLRGAKARDKNGRQIMSFGCANSEVLRVCTSELLNAGHTIKVVNIGKISEDLIARLPVEDGEELRGQYPEFLVIAYLRPKA